MEVAEFLDRVRTLPFYDGQLAHVETLPERSGRFAAPRRPLPAALARLLSARGIEQLYSHQVSALELARDGRDLVVVTGTASGKTLCYHLPILEALIDDPDARALYLYPTKALAQDQLKGLLELLSADAELHERIRPGVYDGDTPTAQRRRIKAEAALVLSNPDMLHASILPYHPKWGQFFSRLRYIVLDEIHTYRGILGAHVACVLRRLLRICRHYDAQPVFLSASATIANPGELSERLLGRPVAVVDDDGSPRGKKYFALWNPAPLGKDRLAHNSPTDDAVQLMVEAIDDGAQTLAFTRTRQAAELVHRYVAQQLTDRNSAHVGKMRAYRGGYLPNERRAIEQDLFSGKLRGVAATNALELGLDVGSLDVALLVGYPGTIASTWQQAGRSGRRHGESLAVLLAGNDPVDHYLLRHPDYFFSRPPEHAVVDPENPYVLTRHLKAAAFELPLSDTDVELFGPLCHPIAELLCDSGDLTAVDGRYYFAGSTNPAVGVNLRHMSDNTFSIVLRGDEKLPGARLSTSDSTGCFSASASTPANIGYGLAGSAVRASTHPTRTHAGHELIANVDAISAPELVYPEAVYLHDGESYLVRELDLAGKVAYVQRRETDYYTQAVLESSVAIRGQRSESQAVPLAVLAYGDVDVTWQTVAFKKIKFQTRENVGLGPVDIPAQTLSTTACWLSPGEEIRGQMKAEGLRPSEGIVGLRNLAVVALPMVAMCDSRDLGGAVDSKNLGRSTLILYDRYPGGLGYCEKGFRQVGALLRLCHQMVAECGCEEGCPSCVGLPNLRPAIHSDPDLARGYPMPNKQATRRLLEWLVADNAASPQSVGLGQRESV